MNLDLTDEEAAALSKELAGVTRKERYPFSGRIHRLKAILAKLGPEPVPRALTAAKGVRAAAGNRKAATL